MAPSRSVSRRWKIASASAGRTRSSAQSEPKSSRSIRPEPFTSQARKSERSRPASSKSTCSPEEELITRRGRLRGLAETPRRLQTVGTPIREKKDAQTPSPALRAQIRAFAAGCLPGRPFSAPPLEQEKFFQEFRPARQWRAALRAAARPPRRGRPARGRPLRPVRRVGRRRTGLVLHRCEFHFWRSFPRGAGFFCGPPKAPHPGKRRLGGVVKGDDANWLGAQGMVSGPTLNWAFATDQLNCQPGLRCLRPPLSGRQQAAGLKAALRGGCSPQRSFRQQVLLLTESPKL